MSDQFNQTVTHIFTTVLGVEPDIEIEKSDSDIQINIKLDPQESGLLIGHHGEVLTSFQLILTLIYQQQSGTRLPVRLNINDYRQQRQLALESLADSVATKVLDRKSPVSISNLSSYERRIVHMYLSQRTDVITHSQGEPPHRVLVVSPL